jgi:anaerobic magnesium-protoporphyrin IX monomethyl ester cyclase
MKIMLINPPSIPFNNKKVLIEPIDLLTLATYLNQFSHEIKVVDMDIKRMNFQSLQNLILKFSPEVMILPFDYHIPLHNQGSVEIVKRICVLSKKHKLKTIVCGKTATFFPEEFLNSGANIVIKGEAELSLKLLLELPKWTINNLLKINNLCFKIDKKIFFTRSSNKKIDLNELPIPNRDLLDISDYIDVRTIWTSRGCNNLCSFCATPNFWGNWRARNAKKVVDEIIYLKKRYNSKKILFLDDNATFYKERMKSISKEILKRKIKIKLGCLGSISNFDFRTMQLMYKAGFRWIHYGIESGSQRILNSVRKGVSITTIHKVIQDTKKIGFRIRTSWILDLPQMTLEDYIATKSLIIQSNSDEIRLHYLTPRVGTKFENINPKNQYIHSNISSCNHTQELKKFTKLLISELVNKNYTLIKTQSFWNNPKDFSKANFKFVSFCPSRYGIGW